MVRSIGAPSAKRPNSAPGTNHFPTLLMGFPMVRLRPPGLRRGFAKSVDKHRLLRSRNLKPQILEQ